MSASVPDTPRKWSEQRVDEWWPAIRRSIRETLKGSIKPEAVSVDSTSGTILALSDGRKPLTNAIMYNDTRSEAEAEDISEAGRNQEEDLGYRIRPSFSVAKLLWLKRNDRKTFDSAWKFVHAADYVNGCLCGNWEYTDHTNALKSGFDLIRYEWPDFLDDLGIPSEKLPTVVAPGEQVGLVAEPASNETGIPSGTPVLAGLTDGCASQIASGAADVGDWETTLGTTLVIKGVTSNLIRDTGGRIYSHLHPERYWMPGGASSTGGEILATRFSDADLGFMDERALAKAPTGLVAYPLARTGERFPFVSPDARGFLLGKPADDIELYASQLEGVGYVERMAYEVLEDLGAEVGNEIFTVGGGTRSETWMRIRASILEKTLLRPRVPEAAMGMAILAASSIRGEELGETARKMIEIDFRIEPDPEVTGTYSSNYERFRDEIDSRYLGKS
jgi:xylulokinase